MRPQGKGMEHMLHKVEARLQNLKVTLRGHYYPIKRQNLRCFPRVLNLSSRGKHRQR